MKNQPKRKDTKALAWLKTTSACSLNKAPKMMNTKIRIAEVKNTGLLTRGKGPKRPTFT